MSETPEEWEERVTKANQAVHNAITELVRAWGGEQNLFVDDYVFVAHYKDLDTGKGGLHIAQGEDGVPYRAKGLLYEGIDLIDSPPLIPPPHER